MKKIISFICLLTLCCCHVFGQTKQAKVPFIDSLQFMNFVELQNSMEAKGNKIVIDQVNWPVAFSYMPSCIVTLARSNSHLAIIYHVRGFDIKAETIEDNGPVWRDSCCEFFVSNPTKPIYYNFEMNCIGAVLKQAGPDIAHRENANKAELAKIIRYSSLPKAKIDKENSIFEWTTAIIIPFESMGMDGNNLPKKVKANFFKCGDETAHPHFVSWNAIKTDKPNFHKPEFFGELIFEN